MKWIDKPQQLIWLNPNRVQWICRVNSHPEIDHWGFWRKGNPRRFAGAIIPDIHLCRSEHFRENIHCIAMWERFIKGKRWSQTLYCGFWEPIAPAHGISTWKEFKEKLLNPWDRLYHSIRNQGYLPHQDPLDNIQVALSNEPEIFLCDGRHRLFFAQILGVPKVPVIVNVFSEELVERVPEATPTKVWEYLNL